MGFRENLKDELRFQDIKVKELESMTGISHNTINHYLAENGTSPLAEQAVKIAKALNISVEYLVTGIDSATPRNIKPEVLNLINQLNCMNADDLNLISNLIERLRKK